MEVLIVIDVPDLGQKIEGARRADTRSLVEICQLVGVSRETWYKLEKEEQAISLTMLRKIEEVLGVNFEVEQVQEQR